MPTCVGMSMEHSNWRSFMRKHWRMATVFARGAALVFAGSVYVFLWFVGNAESSGPVPMTLGLCTMSHKTTIGVYDVLWELLLVGIPIAIAAVAGWEWWNRPHEPERKFHIGGRKRSTGGGGG